MYLSDYALAQIGKPLADPLRAIADAQKQANRVKAAELLIESAVSSGDYESRDNALRYLKSVVR
jgi:hypothetical protein